MIFQKISDPLSGEYCDIKRKTELNVQDFLYEVDEGGLEKIVPPGYIGRLRHKDSRGASEANGTDVNSGQGSFLIPLEGNKKAERAVKTSPTTDKNMNKGHNWQNDVNFFSTKWFH